MMEHSLLALSDLDPQQRESVRRLWNNEYPHSLHLALPADFDAYLAKLEETEHLLVIDAATGVKGWAATFLRDGERWFAMILDHTLHGRGTGSQLLRLFQERHPALYGWVIDHGTAVKANGEYYSSPLAFYRKNGFSVENDTRLEIPTMSAVKIAWKNSRD